MEWIFSCKSIKRRNKMQEEMRRNTLESLVENEKKGTIYAKITKSHPYNTIHGG